MLKYFENVRLVRMADGKTYKLIRDLGLVKGGKGLRYHEPILTISFQMFKPSGKMKMRVPLSSILNQLFATAKSRPAL